MQQRLRKFTRDPEQLPNRQITNRSLAAIDSMERYRFLPTSLFVSLVEGNGRITQQHLQTLFHQGLVNRFTFPRIGTPGEFHYYLDNLKALDLLVSYGVDPGYLDYDGARRNREKRYSDVHDRKRSEDVQGQFLFLKHEVMISRYHVMLELACRQSHGQVDLTDWRQGPELWHSVEVPQLEFLGKTWRELDEMERLPHRPDAFITIEFPREPAHEPTHFFYEADRKTTATKKHNRERRAHFHYIVKQRRQEGDYGLKCIRGVLIETLDDAWAEELRQAAKQPVVSGSRPSPPFWFTPSRLISKPTGIFEKVWASPAEDKLLSLLD